MIVRDAAEKVLSMLELEDEEEYDLAKAVEHINQAIYELAEENEFSFFDSMSLSSIQSPAYLQEDADVPTYNAPQYWLTTPGRLP